MVKSRMKRTWIEFQRLFLPYIDIPPETIHLQQARDSGPQFDILRNTSTCFCWSQSTQFLELLLTVNALVPKNHTYPIHPILENASKLEHAPYSMPSDMFQPLYLEVRVPVYHRERNRRPLLPQPRNPTTFSRWRSQHRHQRQDRRSGPCHPYLYRQNPTSPPDDEAQGRLGT